ESAASMTPYQPVYIMQSLVYALPGNKSTIVYTSGSGSGTTWTTTYGSEADVKTGFGPFGSGEVDQSITLSNKTAVTLSSSDVEKYSYASDDVNHNEDVFVLWVNPTVVVYGGCSGSQLSVSQGSTAIYGASTNAPWLNPAQINPVGGQQPILMPF